MPSCPPSLVTWAPVTPGLTRSGLTESERAAGGVGRRLRGRNIFAHSDVEVGSSVSASVVSDNTHLYRRSRSAHTLDNKSTKKYLLKSKGNKALDDVSSNMKLIENSLGLESSGSKSDLKDINGVIYEIEGEIKTKENQIAELYKQLHTQNYSRDDNTKIEQKLGLLETQMNAKILQMQNKKAKLFKMKKNHDYGGGNTHKSQSLSSLYDFVTQAPDETILFCSNVTYDNINKTSLGRDGVGLFVTEDINFQLRAGDRFLSINEKNIFNVSSEEWTQLRVSVAFPVQAVVIRQQRTKTPGQAAPGSGQFCSPDISGIKEDIAIIQSTLEQKLTEGRNVSTELDRAKKEKKSLQAENMRLNHRIAYLEDQTTELQEGLKQVRDSLSRTLNTTDIIQVITRLDVGSESSGLGSEGGSEGSHSPPLGQNHSGSTVYGHRDPLPLETDNPDMENDFISRLLIGSEAGKTRK